MDATPWPTRRPPTRTVIWVAAAFAVVALAGMLALDAPIARAIADYQPSKLWDAGIDAGDYVLLFWVHKVALPVVLVAGMLVFVVVKRLRAYAPVWMLVAGVHLISRMTTNWIKDATGRFRPAEWIKHGGDDTFGWQGGISFPSGHVVLWASLLVPLWLVAPKKWQPYVAALAIAIVGFIATAKVATNAHFVSDVAGSVTLVLAWTYLIGFAVRPVRAD